MKRKCGCKVLHCEEVRLNHHFHTNVDRFPDVIKQTHVFDLWCYYLKLKPESDLSTTRIWIGHFDVVDMNVSTFNNDENGNSIYDCQGLLPGVTKRRLKKDHKCYNLPPCPIMTIDQIKNTIYMKLLPRIKLISNNNSITPTTTNQFKLPQI